MKSKDSQDVGLKIGGRDYFRRAKDLATRESCIQDWTSKNLRI